MKELSLIKVVTTKDNRVTERELEYLKMWLEGYSSKQISLANKIPEYKLKSLITRACLKALYQSTTNDEILKKTYIH